MDQTNRRFTDSVSRRFVYRILECSSRENTRETCWKSGEESVKIIVVSTLARLMLKVHSLVVVALQYARIRVCNGEYQPLY